MLRLLNWGILSTGRIAGVFADGVARARVSRVVAVGSRSQEKADRFADEHGIATAYGTYEALLADPRVQAVYIATPHPSHLEWILRAAEARKHVLCEKPIGLNHAEAMIAAEACRAQGVLLMEAYMYRCHPQLARVVELIKSGALGTVEVLQVPFSFHADYDPASRIWSNTLAGGGILDVGGYTVSFARKIAGVALGREFAEPISLSAAGRLHPETGVDAYASALLTFPQTIIAQVSCGVGLEQNNTVWIYGSEGRLEIPNPWVPTRDGGMSRMFLHRRGAAAPEEIRVESREPLYALEADAVSEAVYAGRTEVPQMTVADTLGTMKVLDQWRAAIGLEYAVEKPEAWLQNSVRRPVRPKPATPMRYGNLAGLDKPVSRLVMGCDNQHAMPHAAAMWDDFVERGGTTFDTAHIYAEGQVERLLGHWLTQRRLREQMVVIGKGAHTPFCTPAQIAPQLTESLERLQTDHLDLYLLHRDNVDVPVGEFVDALNALVQEGRIRQFGGSNWTYERVAEANAYAAQKGLQGFGALSNQFSLARMVAPLWPGCVSAGDPASRAWLQQTQLPLFAWSSQARGFFSDRPSGSPQEEAERTAGWHSPDNFERRARATVLAKKKGATPLAIAGAYVLTQPFPTFALIGPRTVTETATSLDCLRVDLSPSECAWLNLETDQLGS